MDYPKRKLPRLSGFDYSGENYYFVTICTHDRQCLFGMPGQRSGFGEIAEEELRNISAHNPAVRVDRYVIMPNHIHAVIVIGCDGLAERSRPLPTLSTVVGLYKSGVSRRIRQIQPGAVIWQKSFYDRILREDAGYQQVVKYIDENPLKWELDEYYEKEG